jgi:6,7-dimethyl-8-ribityllumazine synthase
MTTNFTKTTTALPSGKRLAFVIAGWHRDIVEQSLIGFKQALAEGGIDPDLIDVFDVPGSLEIPLQCKKLSQTGDYAIMVAAGLIVDGGIYRHEFVASSVLDAMMGVQLQAEVPILSIVLTPHHFTEHNEAHHSFFFKHFKLKGEEAAMACLQIFERNKISK